MSFVKKLVRVVLSPLSLIDKKLGNFVAQVGGMVLSIVNPIAGAAYMAAWSMVNKPRSPSVPSSLLGRLQTNIDPRAYRKLVFGRTAMANDIRDLEYLGSEEEYLHYFIVVASHKVSSIQQIYFDDKLAWDSSGVKSPFIDYLTVATRLEGSAANAINISPRMGATRRFTGCAYVHLRFRRTGTSDKANSPFASTIPSRITTVGEGMACYDPRQDSTVTGGSGPMRATDQATWTYGTHARNPACQMLTWLLGWKINGKLAVGKGIPPARLHLQSFMAAANICDEPIALAAGGTQPRYRSDGLFSESDGMDTILDVFKNTMAAELDDSDGRLALYVMVNDLATPVANFDSSCFLSDLTWSPVAEVSDQFNRVVGQFVDPSVLSLYQMLDYPDVTVPSLDGIERTFSLPLAFTQDVRQAQRLAKQVLQRAQYGGILELTTDHTGWRVQKYDIVTITHPPLGFASKLFRVAAMTVGTHGQVSFTLREENAAIYAWDRDERAAVQPVAPTSYDYSNNPIVMGIAEAGTNVIWTKSDVTPATPAPSAGTPTGWYDSSDDIPAGDEPVWISLGLRDVQGEYQWQAPIESALDLRYWEAVDADGFIREDKVGTNAIQAGAVSSSDGQTAAGGLAAWVASIFDLAAAVVPPSAAGASFIQILGYASIRQNGTAAVQCYPVVRLYVIPAASVSAYIASNPNPRLRNPAAYGVVLNRTDTQTGDMGVYYASTLVKLEVSPEVGSMYVVAVDTVQYPGSGSRTFDWNAEMSIEVMRR